MGRATSALGWILVGVFLVAGVVLAVCGFVLVVSGLTGAHGTGADVGGIASGSSLFAGGICTAIGFAILAFTVTFAMPRRRRGGRSSQAALANRPRQPGAERRVKRR